MPRISGWENGLNSQRVFSDSCAMGLTLAAEYRTTTKKWDEAMTTKYIPASLVTASRILGIPTPGCDDLTSCVCTVTSTKTAMSKGTGGRFNSRNGGD